MTDWVKVSGDTKPLDVDLLTSSTNVYEHRNAVLVEKDMDGQKYTQWEYEERTMTYQEYAILQNEKTEAQALYTALMTDTLIEEG